MNQYQEAYYEPKDYIRTNQGSVTKDGKVIYFNQLPQGLNRVVPLKTT